MNDRRTPNLPAAIALCALLVVGLVVLIVFFGWIAPTLGP